MISYCLLLLSSFHFCSSSGFEEKDCELGQWSTWSECSTKCSKGQATRYRNITQKPHGVFSKGCDETNENRECGSYNNGCEMLCEKTTGNCHCKSGYILGSDKKKCYNDNECFLNDGRGQCAQKCIDTEGSYRCSCSKEYILAPDGHACIYNESITCSKKLHIKSSDTPTRCICKNGFDGVRCDRNLTLCSKPGVCRNGDLCQAFIHANKQCLSPTYQIPILLRMTHIEYTTGDKKYQIEEYITDILEGRAHGKTLDTLWSDFTKSRGSNPTYYVEALDDMRVKSSFTFVKFGVMDASVNYRNFKTKEICPLIKSSDIQCVTNKDCDVLKEDGHLCPSVIISYANQISEYQNANTNHNKIKSWVYILISGFAIIIVLLIILLFMYLKRGKHSNHASTLYNNNMSQPIIFNTEYNTLPQRDTIASWNNDPYHPDDTISFEAGNTLYDNDTDSLYKSDGQIPIYESIDNLKSCVDKENLLPRNVMNEYNEPRYLVPRRANIDINTKGNSTDEVNCLDSQNEGSCSKLVVDIPDIPQYASPQSNRDDGDNNKLIVDLTEGEEPRYSSPPGRK